MALNSSSSSSGESSPSSSSDNMYTVLEKCLKTTGGTINLSAYIVTNVLVILPLCALCLYIGVRRWLQSSSTAVSHSDHFTYHLIVNELLSLAGLILVRCGVNTDTNVPIMVFVGLFLFSSNLFGHLFFDTLTCVERYVAVVHPVTYRNLKNSKGARIRNVTTGCTWLLSLLVATVLIIKGDIFMFFTVLSITAFSLLVVSSCSLSVLCVLIRPGPGEVGGGGQQVDQSKLRAFYIILVILAMLLFRLGGSVFIDVSYTLLRLEEKAKCDLIQPLFWTTLPTSLMQLVLFLQRAGMVSCCRNNKQSLNIFFTISNNNNSKAETQASMTDHKK